MSANLFAEFCHVFPFSETRKDQQAVGFLWFLGRSTGRSEVSLNEIIACFPAAKFPSPNPSRLKADLKRNRDVHKGQSPNTLRLSRAASESFDAKFGFLFSNPAPHEAAVRAGVDTTPFLSKEEIKGAHAMAELYVVLHCYENSARRLIESVLSKKFGPSWWEKCAATPMKTKVTDRQMKEARNRWLQPRGTSPLFYVDWGDLLTLIRKHEAEFLPVVKDLKFVELRFEELERIRNITAHHGALENDHDFDRVVISFKDWCRQVL